ncbi:MAG: hypothetical protein IAI48_03195 [Candidatus Eremiobacteraeota bacterium]|nr:hypothetical protein [Candidatus Eremiobacteraeota bacterium]
MHPLAAGQARLSVPLRVARTTAASKIRASLGSFVFTVAACAPGAHALATADDRSYGTATFTWLVDHDPSAVMVWRVPAAEVRRLLPGERVLDAPATATCAAAKREHALLVLIAPAARRADRDVAEDCGFALARDAGGIVVAPR